MTILCKGIVALFSLSLASTVALADVGIATLSDLDGKVLVNSGEGFVPAAADMVLKAGDRVFVGDKSLATLSYESCAVILDKPAVVAVSVENGCNTALTVLPVADVYTPPSVHGIAGIPPVVFLTTAAVLGATCLVACSAVFGDNDNTVSGQ